MRHEPKVQPTLLLSAVCARSGCRFLEHVRSSSCLRQDHPATSTVANELLSSHFAAFHVDCWQSQLPVRTSHPYFHPQRQTVFILEALHRTKPNIRCSVKDGLTVFAFRAVPSERKTNFRRPPVDHNSHELNRTSLQQLARNTWLCQVRARLLTGISLELRQ